MSETEIIDIIAGVIVLAPVVVLPCAAIWSLRKTHAAEIFAIWYVESFFFIFFLAAGLFAKSRGIHPVDFCGGYKETCNEIIKHLVSIESEMIFVGAFAILALAPQLLTYLLSGLSGSAFAPKFFWEIRKFAVLSVIKFAAGLGGIVASQFLLQYLADKMPFSSTAFMGMLLPIGAPFVIAAIDAFVFETLPRLLSQQERLLKPLASVHSFFTRNVPPEPPEPPRSLTRQALIALLESDAVYDFITSQGRSK